MQDPTKGQEGARPEATLGEATGLMSVEMHAAEVASLQDHIRHVSSLYATMMSERNELADAAAQMKEDRRAAVEAAQKAEGAQRQAEIEGCQAKGDVVRLSREINSILAKNRELFTAKQAEQARRQKAQREALVARRQLLDVGSSPKPYDPSLLSAEEVIAFAGEILAEGLRRLFMDMAALFDSFRAWMASEQGQRFVVAVTEANRIIAATQDAASDTAAAPAAEALWQNELACAKPHVGLAVRELRAALAADALGTLQALGAWHAGPGAGYIDDSDDLSNINIAALLAARTPGLGPQHLRYHDGVLEMDTPVGESPCYAPDDCEREPDAVAPAEVPR